MKKKEARSGRLTGEPRVRKKMAEEKPAKSRTTKAEGDKPVRKPRSSAPSEDAPERLWTRPGEKSGAPRRNVSDSDSRGARRYDNDSDRKPRTRPSNDGDSGYKPRGPRREGDNGGDFKRPYADRRKPEGDSGYKPRGPRREGDSGGEYKRPYSDRRKPEGDSGYKPRGPRREGDSGGDFKRPYSDRRKPEGDSGYKPRGPRREGDSGGEYKRPYSDRRKPEGDSGYKPRGPRREGDSGGEFKRPYSERKSYGKANDRPYKKSYSKKVKSEDPSKPTLAEQGLIRLNKFIANAGICSRREADDLITSGNITVNGQVITELGHAVTSADEVKFNGQRLYAGEMTYLLLNKPKDTITTLEDPEGRRTVKELLKGVTDLRVFPVGRLDRNTTGLLLFTNDGELAQRLTHPKYHITKIYYAELNANLKKVDLEKLRKGIELEDGFMKPDSVEYAEGMDKNCIGIEIHSGRNRIIHRLFEALGYYVDKLDRTYYAGLTKKDLSRGSFRPLTANEIKSLKQLTGMK